MFGFYFKKTTITPSKETFFYLVDNQCYNICKIINKYYPQ